MCRIIGVFMCRSVYVCRSVYTERNKNVQHIESDVRVFQQQLDNIRTEIDKVNFITQ